MRNVKSFFVTFTTRFTDNERQKILDTLDATVNLFITNNKFYLVSSEDVLISNYGTNGMSLVRTVVYESIGQE